MSRSSRGFTLLEMLIAISILATLTVFITRSITQALFSKTKIQTQIDEMSAVRDSLRIMEKDVNLAFHYRDLEKEFRDTVKKTNSGAPAGANGRVPREGDTLQARTYDPSSERKDTNRQNPETHFEGKENQMDFPTMNTSRLQENLQQADFVEVGYRLKSCKRISGKQESTQCLVRRERIYVDGDPLVGGTETILLENVSEFKLRYLGKGVQDWVNQWNSKNGDGAARENFPQSVEISLTTENGEGTRKRKISMQIVAPVRFANNKSSSAGPTIPGSPLGAPTPSPSPGGT